MDLRRLKSTILKKIEESENSLRYYKLIRKLRNYTLCKYLWVRSYLKKDITTKNNTKTTNIYHVSVQKTGSQWIKKVFSDKRVVRMTGMVPFPQHRYEFGEFISVFPPFTFVPGLYIPHLLYKEIEKPDNYATIYVVRDPRNIILSWYFSMRYSHRIVNDRVAAHRKKLRSLSKEEGINYSIRTLHPKMSFMKSWMYHNNELPNTLFVRFEDLTRNPLSQFSRMFDHCGFDISDSYLKNILRDYTKEKMRNRDKQTRSSKMSTYSKDGSDWEKEFTRTNKKVFDNTYGNILEITGYS